MLVTILLVILILALIGSVPNLGYTQGWGPSGVLGTVLVVILILYLLKAI